VTSVQPVGSVRGRTIRLIWTEGPTKGATHEHVFHQDGTVEWYDPKAPKASDPKERPKYGAHRVADGIYMVSYLAPSGYTLTVVLNFRDHNVGGFASGAQEWYSVEGTFEVINTTEPASR
jgi:hypothetical protein